MLKQKPEEQATREVTFTFSEEAYKALETLAEEKCITMAEVLRDAISLEQWIDELRQDKGSRLIVERDGERTEIVLR